MLDFARLKLTQPSKLSLAGAELGNYKKAIVHDYFLNASFLLLSLTKLIAEGFEDVSSFSFSTF